MKGESDIKDLKVKMLEEEIARVIADNRKALKSQFPEKSDCEIKLEKKNRSRKAKENGRDSSSPAPRSGNYRNILQF